jgi:hypothetical protein
MSLLRRIERSRLPRLGELVKILQHNRVIAHGRVIAADHRSTTIAGNGLIDLDTEALRRGINDGSIRVEREATLSPGSH